MKQYGRKYKSSKQKLTLMALFLIILTPNLFTLYYSTDLRGHVLMSLGYFFIALFTWLLIYYLLPKKIFLVLGCLALLFSPLEIVTVRSLGTSLNLGITDAILKTNYEEAKEQANAHIGLALLLLGIILLFLFLGFILRKKKTPSKIKWTLVFSFIAMNLLIFVQMFRAVTTNTTFTDKLDTAWGRTTLKYNKIYPISLITNLSAVYSMHQKSKRLNKQLKRFSFGAYQSPSYDGQELIILVIGETARFDNFHINGYTRETTPKLDKLQHLISFSDLYSSANLTSISIPQIITRATPKNFDLQYKEKTIVDAFAEAGFSTAWISSQEMNSPVINRLQNVVNYAYFLKAGSDGKNIYDGMLLPKIRYYLHNDQENKKFIVVHTLGSHYQYGRRYPKSFEIFKPVLPSRGIESMGVTINDKEKLINAYDNSILYTDYFLYQLIKMVDSMHASSTLVYLSDHGESLFDNGNTHILHGNNNPTKQEYHIPYLVWYSNQYLQSFPQKIQALKGNKNKPAMSTATFYTLLDMANIKYNNPDSNATKSLADSLYQPPNDRVLLNTSHQIIHIK